MVLTYISWLQPKLWWHWNSLAFVSIFFCHGGNHEIFKDCCPHPVMFPAKCRTYQMTGSSFIENAGKSIFFSYRIAVIWIQLVIVSHHARYQHSVGPIKGAWSDLYLPYSVTSAPFPRQRVHILPPFSDELFVVLWTEVFGVFSTTAVTGAC